MTSVRPALAGQSIAFVTGKLAEPALRKLVDRLACEHQFQAHVCPQKISVAALMTPSWLVGKLTLPAGVDRVVLPGLCKGEIAPLADSLGVPVELGPSDLHDLPAFLTGQNPAGRREGYGAYDIEILAEINHANRLPLDELRAQATRHRADGADVIDLGCTPGEPWSAIGEAVRCLRDVGLRVSVDSFDATEVSAACRAGAELVLSVDSSNAAAAADWGVEVVVVPDQPIPLREQPAAVWLQSMLRTVSTLDRAGVRYCLDPVLEPVGFGFARSLHRYAQVRDELPDAPMLMGIGNLTELTETDSAGVNLLLLSVCQELGIRRVLTTEVIHWACTAVREASIARQLTHYAVNAGRLPKHVDDRLVTLRSGRPRERGEQELRELQAAIKDRNYRLFAERGRLIAMNGERYEEATDPFALFAALAVADPNHAFYLGWELSKAAIALQLHKRYEQDQTLSWGFLSQDERVGWSRHASSIREPRPEDPEDRPTGG